METVTRIGVSLEPVLLAKFDRMVKEKKYESRSEALRDLVRKAMIDEVMLDPNAQVFGTLTILYDHDASSIVNKLMARQHDFHDNIISTSHVHLDEHFCLEVLVIRGKVKEVRTLADLLGALKGVKHSKLVLTETTTV